MKKRIYYWVEEKYTNKPIISEVILETKVMMNILTARIEPNESFLMLELNGNSEDIKTAIQRLLNYGEIEDVSKSIKQNEDKCIDCGACVVHCPVKAISVEDYKIIFDYDECIGCKNCVKVCPANAVEVLDE
jgi:ferredoxin